MNSMLHKIAKALQDYRPHDLHRKARAAVLVPLFDDGRGPGLVLIRRSEEIRLHRGQMGFPGGMVEEGDRGDLLLTALREAEEEIGLRRDDVRIIGELAQRRTILSDLTVKPYVGSIPFPYSFSPDPREVQSTHVAVLASLRRDVLTGPNTFDLPPPVYPVDGLPVWGLTAGMITELLEVLRK